MPKRAATLQIVLPRRDPGTTANRWLYNGLRAAILEGRLRPGARLPATRELAKSYGLSRGTVVAVFEELRADGYLQSATGSGTFIARELPVARPRRKGAEPTPPERVLPAVRRLSAFGERVRPFGIYVHGPVPAFRPNRIALEHFPAELWSRTASRRLRQTTHGLLLGCAPAGYPPLQRAIADYLATSRGVVCEPEQVIVVTGVQEALDLAAHVLLDPGDSVAMESPGYPGARHIFEALGVRPIDVPVDDEGITVGPELHGARMVYLTPAHQFPLGVRLSLPRRLSLLEWARTNGTVLFEDDYDSEFRFTGRPHQALQGLDRHGTVILAGSFSKVLFPSLRLGYLVVPADLVDPISAAISLRSRHAPLLDQAVLADFISAGHFTRHVRRMRDIYAERLSVLIECARAELAGVLQVSEIEAGLQTVGWLADGITGEQAAEAARAHGVEVVPLSRFGRMTPVREGVQLGFAGVPPEEIRRGVRGLAKGLLTGRMIV